MLMLLAALTLLPASAVHADLLGPIDQFPGAAVPEAVLGAVLGAAALGALASPSASWPFALGATLLALLGTLYGLSVTVPRGEAGDIAYHVGLLLALLVTLGMLVGQRRRA